MPSTTTGKRSTEIRAGLSTFLTMAYIIVVNPIILGQAGMPTSAVITATVLIAALSSIAMGLFAKLPFALAPGMGINAFFTYSIVIGQGLSWQAALAAVFISGIVFLILSIFKVREMIIDAIPKHIRTAIAVGIGIFIAHIGLQWAGFVVDNPATLVGFSGLMSSGILNVRTLFFIIGFFIIAVLTIKKVPGSLIIGIIVNCVILLILNALGVTSGGAALINVPDKIFALPSFEGFFQLDFRAILGLSILAPVFSLLFTDLFDSVSTFVGLSEAAGFTNKKTGRPKNIERAMIVDAFGSIFSGLFGTSSATVYIESAAGIEEGGRTGTTAVVAGLLFLPFLFLSPLIAFVPQIAVAPVLIIVGTFLIRQLKSIDWSKAVIAIPSFITLIVIPLTYSISQGIIWGLMSYHVLEIFSGRIRKIHPILWVINCIAIPIFLLT